MSPRLATAAPGRRGNAPDRWAWMRNWLATVRRNATIGSGEYPVAERALLDACAFRAAAATRALSEGASPGAGFDLRYLALVHEAIGATHVAQLLHDAHRELCVPMDDARRRARFGALEAALETTPDSLDELLQRFAGGLEPTREAAP